MQGNHIAVVHVGYFTQVSSVETLPLHAGFMCSKLIRREVAVLVYPQRVGRFSFRVQNVVVQDHVDVPRPDFLNLEAYHIVVV